MFETIMTTGAAAAFDWSSFNMPTTLKDQDNTLLPPATLQPNTSQMPTTKGDMSRNKLPSPSCGTSPAAAWPGSGWPGQLSMHPGPSIATSSAFPVTSARPHMPGSSSPLYLVYDPSNSLLHTPEPTPAACRPANLHVLSGLSGAQSPAPGNKNCLTINQLAEQILLREGITLEQALIRLCSISADTASPGGTVPASPGRQHSLYKTELCRSWEETGSCRYGGKCQFAHGREEQRPVQRHPKYKTEICRTFATTGTCPYGTRCRFIHYAGNPSAILGTSEAMTHESAQPAQQAQLTSLPPTQLSPTQSPARPAACRALDFGDGASAAQQQPPASPGGRRLPVFVNLAQKGEGPEGPISSTAAQPMQAATEGCADSADINSLAQALNQLQGGDPANVASITNAIALLQRPELSGSWLSAAPPQQQLGQLPAAGAGTGGATSGNMQLLAAQLMEYGLLYNSTAPGGSGYWPASDLMPPGIQAPPGAGHSAGFPVASTHVGGGYGLGCSPNARRLSSDSHLSSFERHQHAVLKAMAVEGAGPHGGHGRGEEHDDTRASLDDQSMRHRALLFAGQLGPHGPLAPQQAVVTSDHPHGHASEIAPTPLHHPRAFCGQDTLPMDQNAAKRTQRRNSHYSHSDVAPAEQRRLLFDDVAVDSFASHPFFTPKHTATATGAVESAPTAALKRCSALPQEAMGFPQRLMGSGPAQVAAPKPSIHGPDQASASHMVQEALSLLGSSSAF